MQFWVRSTIGYLNMHMLTTYSFDFSYLTLLKYI